jgi:hypothetical protein
MQLRVITNIGRYKVDQRLKMDTFYARQLIAAGIAVEENETPAEEKQQKKRRYRRRDLTAEAE